jgi:membrane protein
VFAAIFRFVPDVNLPWKDVLVGGFVTTILFFIGQFVLSAYFANNATFSSYGIVGSVLAFVFYIYYASQILFLGGEFSQVYARSHGWLSDQHAAGAVPAGASGIVAGGESAVLAAGQPSAVERALAEARKRELNRTKQALAQAQQRTRSTAAASSVVSLLAGVLLGGAALVVGVARGLRRGRSA